MAFNILKTRKGRLKERIELELSNTTPNIDKILSIVDMYEKDNLDTINKFKREKNLDVRRINGALKQTINAHSVITKDLIGSASKRIMGALLIDKKTKKEKICEKISSIYHTFLCIVIFIIKLDFMKKNKDKICVTISKENNERLISESINKSKLIDKLITEYFKRRIK